MQDLSVDSDIHESQSLTDPMDLIADYQTDSLVIHNGNNVVDDNSLVELTGDGDDVHLAHNNGGITRLVHLGRPSMQMATVLLSDDSQEDSDINSLQHQVVLSDGTLSNGDLALELTEQ